MSFKWRSIASKTEYANEPVREDYETEEEFIADHNEWEEAQKGPNPTHNDDQDVEHGPGATGWVNPDTVTGPGVGGTFVNEGPGVQANADEHTGPGVQ